MPTALAICLAEVLLCLSLARTAAGHDFGLCDRDYECFGQLLRPIWFEQRLPLPQIGLLWYALIFGALLVGVLSTRHRRVALTFGRRLLVLGAVVSIVLVATAIVRYGSFCKYCLGSASLAVALALMPLSEESFGFNRKTYLVVGIGAPLVAVLFSIRLAGLQGVKPRFDSAAVSSLHASDLLAGNAVRIGWSASGSAVVAFLDLECGPCRAFLRNLPPSPAHLLLVRFGGFPIGSESYKLSLLANLCYKRGIVKQFLRKLCAQDRNGVEISEALEIARALGVPAAEAQAAVYNPTVEEDHAIRADVRLSERLEMRGTPAFLKTESNRAVREVTGQEVLLYLHQR